MKRLTRVLGAACALIAALGLSAAAWAQDASPLAGPVSGPVAIVDVRTGARLQDKADEYGERDVQELMDAFHDAVADALIEAGRFAGEDAVGANELVLVIEDAMPNRPTRQQMRSQPSLSMRSFSIGGADVSAVLTASDGTVVRELEYSWRTRSIRDAHFRSVWTDAERTFDRFADRLVDALEREDS